MLHLNAIKKYRMRYNNSTTCLLTVFEIALVRLSETSDYLHGQVNNPSAVIRGTSENLQPDCTVPTSDQTPLKLIQIWARRMTQSTA